MHVAEALKNSTKIVKWDTLYQKLLFNLVNLVMLPVNNSKLIWNP